MNKRRICVVTGSRADYGQLYWLMKGLRHDAEFELQVIATGTHLDSEFGSTYRVIEKDGFRINKKISILTKDDSSKGVVLSLAQAVEGFAKAFDHLRPSLVVLLGDRYEVLAAAQSCLIMKIPVAHIAGGDVTEGAFDEAIRHSISKMSHIHFPTNRLAAARLKQLGENPEYIFNLGSPSLDYVHRLKFLNRVKLERILGFKFRPKNLLIAFHPATLELESATKQFCELLQALERLGQEVGLVFTKSNADPQGRILIKMIDEFVSSHPNARSYASLGQPLYLSLMKQADAVVGNSSSGLYEAPSLKIPSVNIGDRQKGRLLASSVINCEPNAEAILKAIREAFEKDCSGTINPYGKENSSERILRKIKELKNPQAFIKKHFFVHSNSTKQERVFIIAEAGVNHNGSLKLAKQLIEEAAAAGVDAVKFQTFKADQVVTRTAKKAEYQQMVTSAEESQWAMIKKLELDENAHYELLKLTQKLGINLLSTPFDLSSVDFLVKKLALKRLKVASGEITNAPLLLKMARYQLTLIVSTGMSTLEEVEEALGVLAFGFTKPKDARPKRSAFREAYFSSEGQRALKSKVALLHCATEYPAPFEDMNLRAMDTLRDAFELPVGLSDHSSGIAIPIAAAARGAVIIEKHLTLDRELPGPDHQASLEPTEFKKMVKSIRQVELSLGNSIKAPVLSELKNRKVARKSIVASRTVRSGDLFSIKNITVKRPGEGLSPFFYWDLLGKKSERDFKKDEPIRLK